MNSKCCPISFLRLTLFREKTSAYVTSDTIEAVLSKRYAKDSRVTVCLRSSNRKVCTENVEVLEEEKGEQRDSANPPRLPAVPMKVDGTAEAARDFVSAAIWR